MSDFTVSKPDVMLSECVFLFRRSTAKRMFHASQRLGSAYGTTLLPNDQSTHACMGGSARDKLLGNVGLGSVAIVATYRTGSTCLFQPMSLVF